MIHRNENTVPISLIYTLYGCDIYSWEAELMKPMYFNWLSNYIKQFLVVFLQDATNLRHENIKMAMLKITLSYHSKQ